MKEVSYQKLRLRELNPYDTERTLRENIYDLEQEMIRIEKLVISMVEQQIPVPVILSWMRQLENNAAEIVYVTSLLEHEIKTYDFAANSTLFVREAETQ